MLIACPKCNVPRELSRDRGKLCRTCTTKANRSRNWTPEGYEQSCIDCGKKWLTNSDTKATRCVSCSGTKLGKEMAQKNVKEPSEKKRYKVVCDDCNEQRFITANPKHRKTNLCGKCSRKATGKANKKEDKMRYFRICPECPEDDCTKQVSSAKLAGIKLCHKHSMKNRTRFVTKPYKKTNKQKTKEKDSETSYAMQRAIEINRQHKEAVKNIDFDKPLISVEKEKSRNMIDDWLKDNEPSIKDHPDMPYSHQIRNTI